MWVEGAVRCSILEGLRVCDRDEQVRIENCLDIYATVERLMVK